MLAMAVILPLGRPESVGLRHLRPEGPDVDSDIRDGVDSLKLTVRP